MKKVKKTNNICTVFTFEARTSYCSNCHTPFSIVKQNGSEDRSESKQSTFGFEYGEEKIPVQRRKFQRQHGFEEQRRQRHVAHERGEACRRRIKHGTLNLMF